jgi:uncharacterized coiled-coil protein SlyX
VDHVYSLDLSELLDRRLGAQDRRSAEQDGLISALQVTAAENARAIAAIREALAEQGAKIAEHGAQIAALRAAVREQNTALARRASLDIQPPPQPPGRMTEQERTAASLASVTASVAQYKAEVLTIEYRVASQGAALDAIHASVATRDDRIAEMDRAIGELGRAVGGLRAKVASADQ